MLGRIVTVAFCTTDGPVGAGTVPLGSRGGRIPGSGPPHYGRSKRRLARVNAMQRVQARKVQERVRSEVLADLTETDHRVVGEHTRQQAATHERDSAKARVTLYRLQKIEHPRFIERPGADDEIDCSGVALEGGEPIAARVHGNQFEHFLKHRFETNGRSRLCCNEHATFKLHMRGLTSLGVIALGYDVDGFEENLRRWGHRTAHPKHEMAARDLQTDGELLRAARDLRSAFECSGVQVRHRSASAATWCLQFRSAKASALRPCSAWSPCAAVSMP